MEIKQAHTSFILYENGSHYDRGVCISDEDSIKKLYPDTTVEVCSFIFERLFKIEGDFVIMKYNIFKKHRNKGKKFFSKRFITKYLKINTKTGNFITVTASGTSRKRRNSVIRTNSFHTLNEFLYVNSGNGSLFLRFSNVVKSHLPDVESKNVMDKFDNQTILKHMPEMFLSFEKFSIFFTERKKIKNSDFGKEYFLKNFYPTEKYLKKNDRKMVQSILDMFGVNSKYSVRLFHKFGSKFNLGLFVFLYKNLGGPFYMGNIRDEIFINRFDELELTNKTTILNNVFFVELSDKEKSNMVKIINSINEQDFSKLSFEIRDHLKMLKTIREYDPLITISATNCRTFDLEHSEFSKLNRKIKKGYELFFEFDDLMLHEIEIPITHNGLTFYPYVLKTETDYMEEGEKMNHCVYNYHNDDRSIIISVRTDNGSDRVTCEFNTKTGEILQVKHFNNKQPPKEFESVVYGDLVMKCHSWSRRGKLKRLNVIKKPIIVNGIAVVEVKNNELMINDLPF